MLKIMKKYEEALAECKMAKTKIACYRAWINAYREALKQAKSDGLITDEVFMYIRTNQLILAAKYIDEEIKKDLGE